MHGTQNGKQTGGHTAVWEEGRDHGTQEERAMLWAGCSGATRVGSPHIWAAGGYWDRNGRRGLFSPLSTTVLIYLQITELGKTPC